MHQGTRRAMSRAARARCRSCAVALLLAAGAACASSTAGTGAPSAAQRPTASRSGAECDPVRQRAARLTEGDTAGLERPRPLTMFLPISAPASVQGRVFTVHVRVDTAGAAIPDSTSVTGIDRNDPFVSRLVASVNKLTFAPAVLEGCAVSAPWHMTMKLFVP
jgi:hypothetical protein